jgi:hypothetical protein
MATILEAPLGILWNLPRSFSMLIKCVKSNYFEFVNQHYVNVGGTDVTDLH